MDANLKGNRYLTLAVVMFAALSAYTTADGIQFVLGVETLVVVVFSWVFALASSIFMAYILLNIQVLLSARKTWALFVSYCSIAVISMFFNYNSFSVHLSAESQEMGKARQLRDEANNLAAYLHSSFASSLGLEKQRQLVAETEVELQNEEDRFRNEGRGPKYHSIKEDLRHQRRVLATAEESFQAGVETIEDLRLAIDQQLTGILLEQDSETTAPAVLERAKSEYDRLLALGLKFGAKEDELSKFRIEFAPDRARRPEQSILAFGAALGLRADAEMTSWERTAVFLAAILAFVLDMPIFLVLFFLGMAQHEASPGEVNAVSSARAQGIREAEEGRESEDPFLF